MEPLLPQRHFRKDLILRARELIGQAEQYGSKLSEEQMTWQPPKGGWSIRQVLGHLVQTNAQYFPKLDKMITSGKKGDPEKMMWRPTFLGRKFLAFFNTPKKVKNPKKFDPQPDLGPQVVDDFVGGMKQLIDYIERSADVSWSKNKTGSPVTALIRFSLGDCLCILVSHAERHFRQIRDRTEHPEFPGAAELRAERHAAYKASLHQR